VTVVEEAEDSAEKT